MDWIRVEDRLPNIKVIVLVCLEDGHITTGIRKYESLYFKEPGYQGITYNCKATHWMPLPVPPKSIADRIQACLYRFRLNSSIREKSLYLGRNEIRDLRKWVDANIVEIPEIPESIETFLGMTVYTVNEDNHMLISRDCSREYK